MWIRALALDVTKSEGSWMARRCPSLLSVLLTVIGMTSERVSNLLHTERARLTALGLNQSLLDLALARYMLKPAEMRRSGPRLMLRILDVECQRRGVPNKYMAIDRAVVDIWTWTTPGGTDMQNRTRALLRWVTAVEWWTRLKSFADTPKCESRYRAWFYRCVRAACRKRVNRWSECGAQSA